MANKRRLTFEVPEELHSQLKAEAAELGISMGSHCSAILSGRGVKPSVGVKFDATKLPTMPLGSLRELCSKISEEEGKDWRRQVGILNTEMRRRYRS